MDLLIAATFLLSWNVQAWMQHAFYPVLLLALLAGSLGLPIPEDVPLIAAGVILSQHPGVASWGGTVAFALLGIMCGDVVLYVLGGRWGPEVFEHRWVKRLITPARLEKTARKFNRYGMWMCFFGRFVMGVRAAMCITAGVMRFPLWRFLLADLAGALISIPLLVWLGYWFANMIPTLTAYMHVVRWVMLGLAVAFVAVVALRWRSKARKLLPASSAASEGTLRRPASPQDSDERPSPGSAKRQPKGSKAETFV